MLEEGACRGDGAGMRRGALKLGAGGIRPHVGSGGGVGPLCL